METHQSELSRDEPSQHQKKEKVPLSVTLIFYCLGLVALLPWNFFITANSFWQYKLRNVTVGEDWDSPEVEETPLQLSFLPTLVVLSNVFCFIFLFFTSWIVTRVSENLRVTVSLVVMLAVMVLITVLAVVNTDEWQSVFYGIVMANVALLNMFEAVYQGSLYGMAGQLASSCTNALVSGMAIAGVLSSLSSIISLAIGGADPITSGIIYFVIADVFLLVSIIQYQLLRKNKYFVTCKTLHESKDVKSSPKSLAAYWIVFKKIWWMSFTLGMSLLITLAVYPAVQVYITSNAEGGPWKDVYFEPTVTYLLFNVGDVLGRELPRWVRWPGPKGWLLPALSCSRVLFIVLIMLCYGENKTFVTLFYSDGVYIVLNFLFGLTNGYFGCLPFIYYPDMVTPEETELAGTIMGAVMGAGMVIGSCLSPAFVALWGPVTS